MITLIITTIWHLIQKKHQQLIGYWVRHCVCQMESHLLQWGMQLFCRSQSAAIDHVWSPVSRQAETEALPRRVQTCSLTLTSVFGGEVWDEISMWLKQFVRWACGNVPHRFLYHTTRFKEAGSPSPGSSSSFLFWNHMIATLLVFCAAEHLEFYR